MPIARFQMEDGRIARFEVPEGTTPEQAQTMMQEHFAGQKTPEQPLPPLGQDLASRIPGVPQQPTPEEEPSWTQKLHAGIEAAGGTAMGAVAGLAAMPYAVGRSLIDKATDKITGSQDTQTMPEKAQQYLEGAMKYVPMSQDPLAQKYMGKIGEVAGVLPPVMPELAQAGALAKASLAQKTEIAKNLTEKAQSLYSKDVTDANYFMDKGFKIVPHEIKAGEKGTVASVVEGVAGEKRIADEISKHNQEIANKVGREDIGVAPDERLTFDAIKEKKVEAYKPYDAIRNYGADLKLKFKFDDPLYQELNGITEKITGSALAEERPSAESVMKIKRSVNDIKKEIYGEGDKMGKLSPAASIDLIKKLREESSDLYARKKFGTVSSDDLQMAQVKYEAANALENMLERKLPPEMVTNFKEARKQLSKLHTYGEILNPETGNLEIRKLAREKYKDKPFTEGLADLRAFSNKYKLSSKPETQQRPHGVSPLEAGLAVYDVVKHPVRSALVGARVAARPALTSNVMQRAAIPKIDIKPSATARLAGKAAGITPEKAQAVITAANLQAEQERARRKRERANK